MTGIAHASLPRELLIPLVFKENHEQGCSCHLEDSPQGDSSKEGGFSNPPITSLRAAGPRSELPERTHETRRLQQTRRLQPSPAKNLGDSPVSLLRRSLGAVPGFSRLTVCVANFKNRDCLKVFEKAAPHFVSLWLRRRLMFWCLENLVISLNGFIHDASRGRMHLEIALQKKRIRANPFARNSLHL